MIDPVVISFATHGVSEVSQAFEQVSARVRRFEDQASREAQRGTRTRVKATEDEERQKERAYRKLQAESEKLEKQQTRDQERERKRRDQIVERSAQMAGRYAGEQAKKEIAEAERAAREVEKLEAQKLRIRERSATMAGQYAARQAAEEMRAAERASNARGRLGRRIGGLVHGSVGGLVSKAATLASATLGLGGGFLLADAGRKEMAAERQAALLLNAVTTGNGPPEGASVQNILGRATAEAKAGGFDRGELIGAALTYSRNARGGDYQGAMNNMAFFAKMSRVTGTDINDLAEAAGTLQSQNQNLKAPEMQQLLLNAYAQSKQGSMSLVDAAKQFGVLGSTRAYYAGDVARNQQTLIGLGQIARAGGDVGEAGTFVKDIAIEATNANQKFRKQHGHDLIKRDAKTGLMGTPEEVIEQVFRGTGGNIAEISGLFGARGSRLFGELGGTFRAASTAAGGGQKGLEAGIQAVLANVRQVTGATMTPAQLAQQDQQVMNTPAEKFRMAVNSIQETLETKLEPRLEAFTTNTLPKLVPVFEKIIDTGDRFASWFADNPIKGIGAVVLAAISKDLAAAGIGAAVKAIITAMLTSTATAGGGAAAAGAAGGGGAAAGGGGAVASVGRMGGSVLAGAGGAVAAGIGLAAMGYATVRQDTESARRGITAAQAFAAQSTPAQIAARIQELSPEVARLQKYKADKGELTGAERKLNVAELQGTVDELNRILKSVKGSMGDAAQRLATNAPIKSGAPAVDINQRPNH